MDSTPKFSSKDEECTYWRNKAQELAKELDETKEELEEFQTSSHELEQELDTQLKIEEKRNKELASSNTRLQNECDSVKEKLQTLQAESHKRVTELEDNYAKVNAFKMELHKYVRELEQDNDDLERAKRATIVSLEDFEQRLNEAIERNAILESELDEKEALIDTVQRLKDESRDLKQEIGVSRRQTAPREVVSPAGETTSSAQPMLDSGYSAQVVTPTTPTTPMNKVPQTPSMGSTTNPTTTGTSTPLTPSARISALNIVGDLLRKVGLMVCQRKSLSLGKEDGYASDSGVDADAMALENKLATCRNFVKEDPHSKATPPSTSNPSTTSPLNSPRSKRMARGSSLPVQQGLKMIASVK